MSIIYLIRHGKTEANERHLYCGKTDLPLSSGGIEALKALKGRYSVPERCRFITSGMLRTEQTLECLFGAVPHSVEPGLREMDFGTFEMRGYEELKTDPAYQTWLAGDNHTNIPPGGESGDMMEHRVLAAFRTLMESNRNAVIITHGGVIAAIMKHLFPCEHKNLYEWQPEPGYGYIIAGDRYLRLVQ